MAANPFPSWLTEVAADAAVVWPDDITAEAQGNQWSFALTPEEAAAVAPTDVEVFVAGVAEGRRAWLAERGAGPMILYCWHDEQAGQLRFSLVSASHGRLPFGCDVAPVGSVGAVATDWLGSPYLHGIPLDLAQPPASDETPPEPPRFVLSVWSVRVP